MKIINKIYFFKLIFKTQCVVHTYSTPQLSRIPGAQQRRPSRTPGAQRRRPSRTPGAQRRRLSAVTDSDALELGPSHHCFRGLTGGDWTTTPEP